jgi:hypothetical protein
MGKSLFQKNSPEKSTPSPYDLIGPEIDHLKKGTSVRYGSKKTSSTPAWAMVIGFIGLAYLYFLDPVVHAWYLGDAVNAYLYLHNFGTTAQTNKLVASGIFTPEEVNVLNRRTGEFNTLYPSPSAANEQSEEIITYMANVHLLHEGKYESLDPIGRMRYLLFIKTGIYLPTEFKFLDPAISE